MSKRGGALFALAAVVCSEHFPDVLVPVPGQPRTPQDLIGLTMRVASSAMLEDHLAHLGAQPTFTKHMETFTGSDAMTNMASQLQIEFGFPMSSDELFKCSAEPSCLQVWTTASSLMDKTVRITDVIGSWSMTETGVGNVCHVNVGKNVAFCHVPSDPYKSGLSWLALGVPTDAPDQEPLPVAVRCHDMGPSNHDAPCHLLAGNEFMAARLDDLDVYSQVRKGDGHSSVEEIGSRVVSLGWWAHASNVTVSANGKCLDVGGGQALNGAPVQLWTCLQNSNQRWNTQLSVPWTSNLHFIGDHGSPSETMMCLDVPGANLVAGQTMWIWECSSVPTQGWIQAENSAFMLRVDDQEWCLERPDDNDGSLPVIQPCSDSPQQEWWVQRSGVSTEKLI